MKRLIFFVSFIHTIFGNLFSAPLPARDSLGQGVEGFVYRVSGNQMPSPDRKPTKPKGILTTVYIFELTNVSQVDRRGQTAFYKAIKTKFVRKLETGADGHFCVPLPPGQYSFFTKINELYYANWFDVNNNIAPVAVLPGKVTRIEIRIDPDANY